MLALITLMFIFFLTASIQNRSEFSYIHFSADPWLIIIIPSSFPRRSHSACTISRNLSP